MTLRDIKILLRSAFSPVCDCEKKPVGRMQLLDDSVDALRRERIKSEERVGIQYEGMTKTLEELVRDL